MTTLRALVEEELAHPVLPQVTEMAAAIAALYGDAARAVLFYGSCLREARLDGLMLDFYLIVSNYPSAYEKRWLAAANRMIPPNVFPFTADGLAAKYAVLSEADFAVLNSPDATTVSVWARFAQPSRLVWSKDAAARDRAVDAVAKAAPTLFDLARPVAAAHDPMAVWQEGFARTYQCELRAEKTTRSGSIVEADPDRYARFGAAIPLTTTMTRPATERVWTKLRKRGKRASVLRIAKASLTFSGGIDYLAWKINRHAGTQIEIKPWQRRFPLVAALFLVPRLLRQGAVR